MTIQTGRNMRTITAYVSTLLEYPRWIIEREVDFTHCRHNGLYKHDTAECASCRFGAGCRWLNQERTPAMDTASCDELILALEAAVQYLQSTAAHKKRCGCDTCAWLRKARQFLHARKA